MLDILVLSLWARRGCLRLLYRACGHWGILPATLKVQAQYDRTGLKVQRGGFADVWRGECHGRDVAVKVVRTYSNSDFQKVVYVGRRLRSIPASPRSQYSTQRFSKEAVLWKFLRHPNVLPLIGVMVSECQFAMVSDWMENGNANEYVKANPDVDRLELVGSYIQPSFSFIGDSRNPPVERCRRGYHLHP